MWLMGHSSNLKIPLRKPKSENLAGSAWICCFLSSYYLEQELSIYAFCFKLKLVENPFTKREGV
jgi:hypothetical protein